MTIVFACVLTSVSKTIPHCHPLPGIQNLLDSLGSSSWFSILALRECIPSRFCEWGIERSNHLSYTLETLRMGKCPSDWLIHQLERVLEGNRDKCCVPYLDNVLCYSKTFDDHVDHLRRVFHRIWQHGIKCHPAKYELFKRQIRYIMWMVFWERIQIDPKGLEGVLALEDKKPRTVGEVRTLLGFLSY